jgi:hypothetical protein
MARWHVGRYRVLVATMEPRKEHAKSPQEMEKRRIRERHPTEKPEMDEWVRDAALATVPIDRGPDYFI